MTSLQTDWEGYYLDGKTAARRPVTIRMMRLGLQVTAENGDTLWWPYEEIRQTQGFYAGEQVRMERGGEFAEALLVPDASFLTHLHRMIPEAAGRFHRPETRKARVRIIGLAAAGSVVIVALLYFWGIPLLGAIVASRLPVSWEEELGRSVVKHLAPPELRCKDTARSQAIKEIVRKLMSPQATSPYTIRVFVVNSSSVNAFAVPGGAIVLTRGLLAETENAEELAGVLAHELQHVVRRHATRALIQRASVRLLLAAMTGNANRAASYGLDAVRAFGLLRYSRRMEEEADREGMRMLLRSGIDPRGMISFFEMLKERGTELPSYLKYLSTHPSTEDRIQKLKSMARQRERGSLKLLPEYDWSDVKKLCSNASQPS